MYVWTGADQSTELTPYTKVQSDNDATVYALLSLKADDHCIQQLPCESKKLHHFIFAITLSNQPLF